MSEKVLLVAVLCVAAFNAVHGQSHNSTLYDQYGHIGNSYSAVDTYIANLSSVNWGNRAKSACAEGVWLYYQWEGFNPTGWGGAQYAYGVGTRNCFETNEVRSMKFAGVPGNYRLPSFTIYQHTWFSGNEYYLTGDSGSVGLRDSHASLIITGTDAWTVYDQANYGGTAKCLFVSGPADSTYLVYLVTDLELEGIPRGSIRSVRKGCHSNIKITLKALEPGSDKVVVSKH